ncbi:MAG: signal peptidase I [Verrucomicrobiota bacterium]
MKLKVVTAQDQAGQSNAGGKQPRMPRWLRIMVFGRKPKATLVRVAVLIIASFVVFRFILLPIRVEGISMLPNYQDRSWNLVNRLAYFRHEPQRGDVVSIRLAGPHVMYLKRIIGLPGESVAFANGRVLIDGEVLDEPYEKLHCDWNCPPVKLGPNEYYVVGDNRTMPPEFHKHGETPRSRIIGKLLL